MGGFVEYFHKGGPVMWPLLFCAIIGLAYVIERFISYALASINVNKFLDTLKRTMREKGVDEGIKMCAKLRQPVAKITKAILEEYKKVGPRKDALEEAASTVGTDELAFIDRGLPVIAAVSTIAPILGFLGTVTGMIRAFNAIALAGEVEPTLVAAGISEALITTATGLSIAFPMVAFHVYFTTRGDSFTRNMEKAATDIITFLLEERPR